MLNRESRSSSNKGGKTTAVAQAPKTAFSSFGMRHEYLKPTSVYVRGFARLTLTYTISVFQLKSGACLVCVILSRQRKATNGWSPSLEFVPQANPSILATLANFDSLWTHRLHPSHSGR